MVDFTPIAASLRSSILDFYVQEAELIEASEMTIATNSELVERRAAPLLEMLASAGVEDVEGLRVVDLGCGFGAIAVYLAAQGAAVTGIDPNGKRLRVGREVAASHGLPLELRRGRMERLEAADGSFDVALQNNSFCYLVDRSRRSAALRETLRVLRPGGTLVTRNPNRWHPIDQFTGLPLIHLLPPAAAVRAAALAGRRRSLCRLTSPRAARRELHAAGFELVSQPGFATGSGKPDALKAVARYQHFLARRPRDRDPTR
jgi:ubiquinone/menaquinone biosynthesis C-methylase UbiE